MIALYTGMRRGEIIGLLWDAIDFEQDLIVVKRSYCRIEKGIKEETKSKKIRYVPICKALKKKLSELNKITGEGDFVCPIFHADRYHIEFKRSFSKLDLRTIRFHDLRHTFASLFMLSGGNLYDFKEILGHSSIQMTERYAHLSPNGLRGKTEILEY